MEKIQLLGMSIAVALIVSCGGNLQESFSANTLSCFNSSLSASSLGAVVEPTLITSSQNAYWQEGNVVEVTGGANVTIDENTTYQNWHGFGGTFNEAGWDALSELSAAERNRAIKLLFDPVEGAGFTYGRIPIGSSDYAMDRYSLAEKSGDYDMESFSIDRDRELLIPFIKAALSVRPDIKFWASPWAPPVWMMKVNSGERYPEDSGTMNSDAKSLKAHALYLARFVEEYALEGIEIEAVQPQNEPGWAQHYPSCAWPGPLMSEYIASYLGPLFAERLPCTEVWLGTMSNTASSAIVSSVMSGESASYVKGIGLQWGMEANASLYASKYDVPIMQTEHRCGNYPWSGGQNGPNDNAPNDHAYGLESWGLLKSWISSGVNSYMAWNMVLDQKGENLDEERLWRQNSLLIVNRESKTLKLTPAYYVFRHLAQYVEPGAVRIKASGGDVLAFKNPDGSIVTILHNSGGLVSKTILSVGGKSLQFNIPARGWATVNWQ